MNNEEYQKKIVEYNYSDIYQGDVVSSQILELVHRYLKSPILDIGAGSGSLINKLRSKNYEVVGIDLFPVVEDIRKGTITNLDFGDNEFNTVFSTEVIEHLTEEQIDKGLNEVKRVLKKGGSLILTVPYNENIEINSYTCLNCGFKFHRVGHLQSFTKERIKKILIEKGFEIKVLEVYPLHVMSKLPKANLYWNLIMLFDKRFGFNKTILIVVRLK